MGRKRRHHKYLPQGMYLKNGTYYCFINSKYLGLGKILSEAIVKFTKVAGIEKSIHTMNDLFNRYIREVLPTKAETTRKCQIYNFSRLRAAFSDVRPEDITPVHVYKYIDKVGSHSKTAANKDLSILSSVFYYAIRWGVLSQNVCRDIKRFSENTRDRYIQDEEFTNFYDKADDLVKAFMMISYLTALRLADVLKIKLQDLTEEGIEVTAGKTGKKSIIEWSDALRQAIDNAKRLKRPVRGIYLFCTKRGAPYSTDGFKSIWRRQMNAALKAQESPLKERFMIKDIRAKAATDIEQERGIALAQALLGHSSPSTTRRHYIRKAQKVRPVK